MNGRIETATRSLRIVAAIASKDIGDALKNKAIVTMLLGMAFMILSTQALPLLLRLKPLPKVVLYDPGDSNLVEALAQRDGFWLRPLPSQREVEQWVSESSEIIVGLSLPTDIDEKISLARQIELDGYWVYWADAAGLADRVAFFEEQLGQVIGKPVAIQIEGNEVYPTFDSGGRPFMFSMGFVLAVIMVGTMFVPYLMIEEKENRTIDALLVSPARYSEVVLGKALAGTFYCLTAAAVMLAFNYVLITQWGLAILAAVCGSLFAVAIGLLLGILFDNIATMNLWLGLVVIILLLPMLLAETMGERFPTIIQMIIPWVPSAALTEVFRASFSNQAPLVMLVSKLGITLLAAALLTALVVWRTRQLNR